MSSVIPEWLKTKIEKTATLSNIDDLDLPSSLKISQPVNNQTGGKKNNDFSEKIKLAYQELSEKYQN